MKPRQAKLISRPMEWVVAFLILINASAIHSQTFKLLHSFNGVDGVRPQSRLLLLGGKLYGTTFGAPNESSTIFSLNTDGSGFSVLQTVSGYLSTRLVSDGAVLYGTLLDGGANGTGSIFKLNFDGTGFSSVYDFSAATRSNETNSDGINPATDLFLAGTNLYGATEGGGPNGFGTFFKLNTDGSGIRILQFFSQSNGELPSSSLVLLANFFLFGTTTQGGSTNVIGGGTIYSYNLSLNEFGTTSFNGLASAFQGTPNMGGSGPSSLVTDGTSLYGVTGAGGTQGGGTVFKFAGYAETLMNFPVAATNYVGSFPTSLALAGSTLYGTAGGGGTNNRGVVFKMRTDGSKFALIKSFQLAEGQTPCSLIITNGTLYGTTLGGGQFDDGTIFSINLAPAVAANAASNGIALAWSAISGENYQAQYSTNLNPTNWINLGGMLSTNAAMLSVADTNTAGTQRFYRVMLMQ